MQVLDTQSDKCFERITRLACRALEIPIAAIVLIDEHGAGEPHLWIKSIHGLSITELPSDFVSCARALLTAGPTVIGDTRQDARFRASALVTDPLHLRFYASHPLHAPDGRCVGSICVLDRQPRRMEPQTVDTLRDLALVAETELKINSLALAQSELSNDLDAVRRQVFIDRLTQTWNRAGILEILTREHARAKRGKRCLGVALVELDHFKQVNATYGNPLGDRILRTAAERMVEAVRPYDAVGRYQDEEFLVVIVERDSDVIGAVAERIRRHVTCAPVSAERKSIPIATSIGVAFTSPRRPIEIHRLLEAADEALYRAKYEGRNRVVVAA
ncbi:MAG: sensor domain-containing diguanylate cyclase [Gammaproteobacteria bacterium]|nr:sensor domain-containing diguanylate cyclase [Gammaproteobacteria bacterium]